MLKRKTESALCKVIIHKQKLHGLCISVDSTAVNKIFELGISNVYSNSG